MKYKKKTKLQPAMVGDKKLLVIENKEHFSSNKEIKKLIKMY
jgi:hypothetical protein